jgi:hypothetical protein
MGHGLKVNFSGTTNLAAGGNNSWLATPAAH